MQIASILAKSSQRKRIISLTFGTIVGVIIFAAILASAGLGQVWSNFSGVDLSAFSVYIGLVICTCLFRAWRFRLLVQKGGVGSFCGIVSVHTLMVNLLPFSGGEISYLLLLRRYGISDGFLQGLPSLVVARMQDVFINGLLALIALTMAGSLGLVFGKVGGSLLLLGGLGALVLGLAWLTLKKEIAKNSKLAKRINEFVSQGLASFKYTSPRVWAATLLTTLAIRIVSLIGVFYLFEAAGVSLPLASMFLIASLYAFLPFLPVNTPAGIGITEAFLLTFLVIGGIEQGFAAAASIQIHFMHLMVSVGLGALGFLLLQYLKRRHSPTRQPTAA